MRGWLISTAAVASLLMLLVLSAAGQDRKAPEAVAPPEQDVLITEPIGLDVQRWTPDTDDAATEDLERAEDLEILGEVLRGALAQLYKRSGSPQWMSENLGVRPLTAWDVNPVGFPVRSPTGEHRLLWTLVDPSHDQRVNLNQPLFDPLQFDVTASEPKYMDLGPGGVAVERPEGIYLKDYGVVYHVRLDVPPPEGERPKETAGDAWVDPPAGRSWENAGRTLRGQPPLEPHGAELTDPVMPTKADLVNTLLDVLTENARNLRHLKGEDRLTVAITFPREKSPAPAAEEGGDKASSSEADVDELVIFSNFVMGEPFVGQANSGELRSSHEVSGDLHMRQQNYQEAIEAYEHALVLAATKATSVRTNADKTAASALRRKLIQAYAAAGELEKARTLINQALASEPKSENRNGSSQPAHAIPLPAKLALTVTKSKLDDVAAGKMKREELNQHATIHYFNPPPETPGLGSRASRAAARRVLLVSQEAGSKTDGQSALFGSLEGKEKEDKLRGSAY